MSTIVTGTYKPEAVAASVFEKEQRIVILHVPRHVSMIGAVRQHLDLIKTADITLQTSDPDIVPGRYRVEDMGDGDGTKMAAFTASTGAKHHTTKTDDIGYVEMDAGAIEKMGPMTRQVFGEKPEQAHISP